jgi:hypothetical protein
VLAKVLQFKKLQNGKQQHLAQTRSWQQLMLAVHPSESSKRQVLVWSLCLQRLPCRKLLLLLLLSQPLSQLFLLQGRRNRARCSSSSYLKSHCRLQHSSMGSP